MQGVGRETAAYRPRADPVVLMLVAILVLAVLLSALIYTHAPRVDARSAHGTGDDELWEQWWNPASPLSPFNPLNPASPLHQAIYNK